MNNKLIVEFIEKAKAKMKEYKNPAALAIEKLEALESMTGEELLGAFGIHICNHADGDKMELMQSINTCCDVNSNCKKRMENGNSICKFCFAHNQQQRYLYLAIANAVNFRILTEYIVPGHKIPKIMLYMFRLESFGDLENEIQALNYFNICYHNQHTRFALWTKNPWIIQNAMEIYGIEKPDNLVIVYSSPIMNIVNDVREKFPFVDKIFTVYDKEHYNQDTLETYDGGKINCGFNKCAYCMNCYFNMKCVFINEAKK